MKWNCLKWNLHILKLLRNNWGVFLCTKRNIHYYEDSSHIILSEDCRVFCPYCDETRRVMKTLVNHIKAAHPNSDTELLPVLFVDADKFQQWHISSSNRSLRMWTCSFLPLIVILTGKTLVNIQKVSEAITYFALCLNTGDNIYLRAVKVRPMQSMCMV